MNIVIPDPGIVWALDKLTGVDLLYALYTNDVTPDKDSVYGDFVQCTTPGYAGITVAVADWSAITTSGHVATRYAPVINFVVDPGYAVDCYGYLIIDATGPTLVGAARFDSAPVSLTPVGIPVLPILGDTSRFG